MYDMIIVGGGPSGLTAALYAGRAELKALMIEKAFHGGQMVTTNEVENYPGIIETTGPELAGIMYEQAIRFGTEVKFEEVIKIEDEGDIKKVVTASNMYEAKTILLSMGAKPRKLGLPNEEALAGKGVSYCAICDGGFYKDKTVAVVGGGDTALEDALYLARLAKKVYLIHRRDSFRANKHLQTRVAQSSVEVIWNSGVTKLNAEETLKSIEITNLIENTTQEIPVDGVFIAVGNIPVTELVKGLVDINEQGYIMTDENCKTNKSGIFAIGDIRQKKLRQIITAAADGAIGVYEAEQYLVEHE